MVELRPAWAVVELRLVWVLDFFLATVSVVSRSRGSNSSPPLPSFWSFLSVGSSRRLSGPSDSSALWFVAVVAVVDDRWWWWYAFGTAEIKIIFEVRF